MGVLTGVVGTSLVERQVAPVDARQPIDKFLWEPVWKGLLLLEMGYIISEKPFFLWVRVFGKVLTLNAYLSSLHLFF